MTGKHPLEVTGVIDLGEDLDKPLAFVKHIIDKKCRILNFYYIKVYIDLPHIVYGVQIDSSLSKAYIVFPFGQQNQHIRI